MKNERGFALIITLLVTALLVALTAEFVNEVYVETSARQSFIDGQQASLLAESGMKASEKILTIRLNQTKITWLADQATLRMMIQAADPRIQVAIEEESGKLNINEIVTHKELFRPIAERLFKKLGLQPELLDAAADWIDADDKPGPFGAETGYYQSLQPPYKAKNGPLETFEELRLIRGFDKATVDKLRPYLTVYSNGLTSQINVNTAPKELIAALSDTMDGVAQAIIDYRNVRPFEAVSDLGKVPGVSGDMYLGLSSTVLTDPPKGNVFRLVSQATVNETARVVEAVYSNDQSRYLYWREY